GPDRLAFLAHHHGAVVVELDVAPVGALHLALGAHDDGAGDLALLHLAVHHRLLDGDDDDVADGRVAPLGPAEHLDAGDLLRAAVVRHVEDGRRLDHGLAPLRLGPRLWYVGLERRVGRPEDLRHPPALVLGHGARLHDPDLIADLASLLFVVGFVLVLLGQVLAVAAVLHAAHDLYHHRLRHLVG